MKYAYVISSISTTKRFNGPDSYVLSISNSMDKAIKKLKDHSKCIEHNFIGWDHIKTMPANHSASVMHGGYVRKLAYIKGINFYNGKDLCLMSYPIK